LAYPKVVNPASLGVQAMFCSSTDFCLSPGIDLVWGKKSFTKQLEPIVFGGGSVDWVSQSGFNFSRDKSRLEPGTPNLPQVLSLSEAAKHLITLSE
jgi:selenocysteine lyase/cysteine desulfurase